MRIILASFHSLGTKPVSQLGLCVKEVCDLMKGFAAKISYKRLLSKRVLAAAVMSINGTGADARLAPAGLGGPKTSKSELQISMLQSLRMLHSAPYQRWRQHTPLDDRSSAQRGTLLSLSMHHPLCETDKFSALLESVPID